MASERVGHSESDDFFESIKRLQQKKLDQLFVKTIINGLTQISKMVYFIKSFSWVHATSRNLR